MKASPAHTLEILRDDIGWLECQVQQLESTNGASERKLANCYQKLLRQRQHQLATRDRQDGTCPGCWQEYFC